MDLSQKKLSKAEWESIETPVLESEKKILKVIMNGFETLNIRFNENLSLLQLLKMTSSNNVSDIEIYFYNEYFIKEIDNIIINLQKIAKRENKDTKKKSDNTITNIIEIIEKWKKENSPKINTKKLKKADIIRIQNMSTNIQLQKKYIFEFLLLEFCEKIIISIASKTTEYGFYLYTLLQFQNISITDINKYVQLFIQFVISFATEKTNIAEVFHRSPEFIEKNKYLLKYEDISLYQHQKQLFSLFKNNRNISRLVLYMAPTGTGKTMSPLGLSHSYKIIFVCVARHVGLALAKSAISMGKKVAFAFGCETAADIRLHYFAASSYSVNNKSGGIYKVDNSIGTNVEIIICDVKSYLVAMYYMLAFNSEEDIITYWDEPTITMDYTQHDLHEIIHKNWVDNRISKLVLSCATLPKENEIEDTLADFRCKFENAEINTISSHDCKKTISLLNKEGKCCLPHLLFDSYEEVIKCAKYCEENKTLLRYFDLEEIIRFIEYVDKNEFIKTPYNISTYFNSISDITMNSIKQYYLIVLSKIQPQNWIIICEHMKSTQNIKFNDKTQIPDKLRKIKSMNNEINDSVFEFSTQSTPITRMQSVNIPLIIQSNYENNSSNHKGILLTTLDAHTLTDGPTIYLVEDVEKLGKFYIEQSNIPEKTFQEIMNKIHDNDTIQKKIQSLEKSLEDAVGSEIEKEKKMERNGFNKETKNIMKQIEILQSQINSISMDSRYIPNSKNHQMLWVPNGEMVYNAFVPTIDDFVVKEIMLVDVSDEMKLLLLMGIGVFVNQPNIKYMEIMKRLAIEQKLYLIIAQSDYIYGTNYQFCHGFIGKDLMNMTQQKTIQAMGRIGRNNIQQEYTVRFRDDSVIMNLFSPMKENIEAVNMSHLFCSD
jgi:hypothetical protein